MLTMLRNATKGWTAKILLLLLVASFAIWGVSGSMLQSVGNAVVTVGETRVSPVEYRLAYDRQLAQLSRQFGTRINREQAEAFGVGNNVLSQLVSGALLDESAREMGLGMSKDKLANLIGEDEAFRDATGQFSRSQLQAVLRSVGMSEEQYVESRQAVAVRNQIIEATVGKANLPDSYWNLLSRYEGEERVFRFVRVDEADIGEIAGPDEETLKAFYDENTENYQAPEFRKLNIVKLEADDIADEAAVTDEAVREDYEARKDSFSSPEKRTIQQLVFTDAEAAEAAAEALQSGKTFEEVVSEQGKSLDDISLGTLVKADIPDTGVAEAAFELDEGETSGLVDGLFGKVILRVTAIEQGSTKPLQEVEAEIRKALALVNAADDIFDTHDRLEDERAAGEPLDSAARNVGLDVRTIEAVDRTARDREGNIINDIPNSRELLAAAFDIDEGVEADPLNIGTDGFVWYEVVEIMPERQKSFEEVRQQVENDWLENERRKAVSALAEQIRQRVANGEVFNTVITDLLPTPEGEPVRIAQQTQPVRRDGEAIGLDTDMISAGFSVPQGTAIMQAEPEGNGHVVLKVEEIISGNADPVAQNRKNRLNTTLADDLVSQLVTRLQEDEDVEINRQAINAALAY